MSLRQLPLHDLHLEHGARFGAFAGYEVPESYAVNTVHEHLHTRKSAGLFDISHKMQLEVSGPDAPALISRLCPVDANALPIGAVKYTFFLNDQAGIIDHMVLLRLAATHFLLIANGARAARNQQHILEHSLGLSAEVRILDRVLLALQGPQADAVLQSLGLPVADLPFMTCREAANGWIISRSGYTGENGLEISLPSADAFDLMDRLLKDERVTLSGQNARNSLRLEAGLCRYGNDLTEDISPVEAGLLRAIPKPVLRIGLFIGAQALTRKVAGGGRLIRTGLQPKVRTLLEEGAPVLDARDNEVGFISSTGEGPSVGCPIAMGYVYSNIAEFGLPIFTVAQGERVALMRRTLPFVPAVKIARKH